MMKEVLSYYYQIVIDDNDYQENGCFSYNNHLFSLQKFERNLEEINSLLALNHYMLSRNIRINQIIPNIQKSSLTYYENHYYVLLKIDYRFSDNYFKFIEAPEIKGLDILKRNNWGFLWSRKIDYVEYQVNHLVNKYPLILDSINYYIGLAENAIMYFNNLNLHDVKLYINHRRVNNHDLYNPCELVIDYKVRDICEYLKKSFFTRKMSIYDIKKYILMLNLEDIDYVLLYTRMLFPSYYFDVYDRIINDGIKEEEITKIVDMAFEYEELLYEIYVIIRRKINIMGIDWINKKFL